MLDYDKEKFWNSLTEEHIRDYEGVRKYGITHNHYELLYQYRKTKFYQSYTAQTADYYDRKTTENIWQEIYDWLTEENRRIVNLHYSQIPDYFIEKQVKKMTEYLLAMGSKSANEYYRFGANHLLQFRGMGVIEKIYNVYNNIQNGIYHNRFLYQHKCAGLWAMCDGGLAEDVVTIGGYYINELKNNESEIILRYSQQYGNKTIDSIPRAIMSFTWPVAQCLKHLKRFDEAKALYRNIMEMSDKNDIGWSTGKNRALEAGIELYKLEPTEEVKQWCYKTLMTLSKMEIGNRGESLHERLIIAYMFYKHILNKELE